MIRLWNRILKMDSNRLPYKIMQQDLAHTGNTWSSEISNILKCVNIIQRFRNREPVDLRKSWILAHGKYYSDWRNEVENKPKLRSYITYKDNYQTELYVLSFMSRSSRSFLAQLRCGILPLELEVGRWHNVSLENRTCKTRDIETELHFLFTCEAYTRERQLFLNNVEIQYQIFEKCRMM